MESLDERYLLSIGDRVGYRVIEDKDDPRSLLISDLGEIDIPYLGRMKAAGKTCKSLAQEVKTALEAELYNRATVIVAVNQLNPKRGTVYLFGYVRSTGPQPIPSDEVLTLSKAILRAGGFGDFANKKKVTVTRPPAEGKTTPTVFVVNVAEILEKSKLGADIRLEAGDMIYVPGRLINL
jgi:protein involved in polysaccharide export with SLBB domain